MVTAHHQGDLRFELKAGRHALLTDQRAEWGGLDSGPMPSELLLWSVAACFGQAVAHVARKMRTPLPGLALEVEGEKDPERFQFRSVRVGVRADCPQALLDRAVTHARKLCFVTNTLEHAIAVEFRVEGQP
jgi:putative redox protein